MKKVESHNLNGSIGLFMNLNVEKDMFLTSFQICISINFHGMAETRIFN